MSTPAATFSHSEALACASVGTLRSTKPDHRPTIYMPMSRTTDHISFEYFPPKTEAGVDKLLSETDPDEAVRLHQQLTELTEELNLCEEKWMELSGEM